MVLCATSVKYYCNFIKTDSLFKENNHIMSKSIFQLLLLLFVLVLSCKPEPIDGPNPTGPDPNNNPDPVVEVITPTGNERYLNTDADYIFDQDKLPYF